MKKFIFLLVLSLSFVILFRPAVSDAAWWNPLDWISYLRHKPTVESKKITATASSTPLRTNVVTSNTQSTKVNSTKKSANPDRKNNETLNPIKFYSTPGKFSIDFPSQPTLSTSTIYLATMPVTAYVYYYLRKIDGELSSVFSTVYIELPSELSFTYSSTGTVQGSLSELLNILITDQVANNHAKLISSSMGNFKNYPSADYQMYDASGKLYIKGRIVISTKKVYMTFVQYRDDMNSAQNLNMADVYLNSLTITP